MNKLTLTLSVILIGTILTYGQTDTVNQTTPPTESGVKWVTVDVAPEFPGGIIKFFDYINKNLKYPKDARKEGIEGKVMIEFVVDSTGAIRPGTVNIVKGLSKSCDDEAIRLIKESPKWIPGRVSAANKNVAVKMVMPINFKR
jgi:protein TonB